MCIRSNRTLVIVLIGIVCCIIVLIASGFDNYFAYAVKRIDPKFKSIVISLKFLGNPLGYLIASAAGVFIFRYLLKIETVWRYCLFFFVAVAGSGILADILKVIFWRARPRTLFDQGIEGFFYFSSSGSLSFPSGHTAIAAAVAAALSLAYPRVTPLVVFLPLSVGAARLIVGAHYLSDVIAGMSIGVLFPLAIRAVLVRRGWWGK